MTDGTSRSLRILRHQLRLLRNAWLWVVVSFWVFRFLRSIRIATYASSRFAPGAIRMGIPANR